MIVMITFQIIQNHPNSHITLLNIERNRLIKPLTTFKIGGPAREFVELAGAAELPDALGYAEAHGLATHILGGGSNMLVSDAGFDGLVIHLANKGIERNGNVLRIASGEIWDDVVAFAVRNELWGIENLSRIPGQAGSVAVQNVGAYGRETKDVLVNVEVFDRETKSFRMLSNVECGFSYRKSIFNTTEKGRYVILYTTIKLSEKPERNISYPDVKEWFDGNAEASLMDIREAIIAIRDRKFPFPAESIEGNAGSFFKNTQLTPEQFDVLEKNFAKNLPGHLERLHHYKPNPLNPKPYTLYPIRVPTAFLLEACGLKGFRRGDVQLNPTQPVIVLNVTGEASADEVLSVVHEVRTIVHEKTGLHLLTEPELIGFGAEELRGYGFHEDEIERYIVKG